MQILKKNNSNDLSIFFEKRMLKIFLLGCISGFPWVLIGSSLSLWLKEEDLSRSTIGWAGLIFTVYAINYLWAPLIDKLKIPFLTKKIGHRKSWIFLMQSFIGLCLLIWSFINPVENLFLVILVGLLIAIFSSTQDITIDALRIEQINITEKNYMAAGASMTVIGWWTGFKLGGLFSLTLSDFFEQLGFNNYWQITFLFLFLIIIFFNYFLLTINEKKYINSNESKSFEINNNNYYKNFLKGFSWIYAAILDPIISSFKKMD